MNKPELELIKISIIFEDDKSGKWERYFFFKVLKGEKRELFGLFRGKTVVVAFDKDKAGQEAQPKVIEELIKAGVPYRIAEWNAKDGKDPNELLKAGKLNTIVS